MNATATALRPVCATPGCGTVLSVYRPRGETLCAACRTRVGAAGSDSELVDVERLVAGILLTSDALRPGEPVDLALELAAYGIAADSWRIALAVRRVAARHGIVARGRRGKPGYRVTRWERRYQPVLAFGGGIMDRDEESGKYRGRLPFGACRERKECEGQLTLDCASIEP